MTTTERKISRLLKKGYAETCIVCGAVSAHAWEDADEEHEIYHIPCASGFEWECGKCGAHHVAVDSPINHPCYTHEEG